MAAAINILFAWSLTDSARASSQEDRDGKQDRCFQVDPKNWDRLISDVNSSRSWASLQTFKCRIAGVGSLGALTPGLGILGDSKASTIDSIVNMGSAFPLTDAGFTAAVLAAMPGQTIRIPLGQMVSLTSAHNITKQISILCDPGAGFYYPAASGAYIELSGAGSVMSGCRLKGRGPATAQQALIMN